MGRELMPYDGNMAYIEAPAAPAQTIDLRRLMVALRRQRTDHPAARRAAGDAGPDLFHRQA